MRPNPRFITFTFSRNDNKFLRRMSSNTVIRLTGWGVCIMVVLQLVFHFVFQLLGYDSLVLSITLVTSVVVFLIIFAVWQVLNKTVRKENVDRS
jgi:ABC-type bacteriocin/lantibiotic exporter with double-glycine peptidase domain